MPAAAPWFRYVILLGLGGIHALGFSPDPLPGWSLPFVQLVCLAFLFWHVFASPSTGRAAWRGFAFGLGFFIVGLYWIFISLHTYGGLAAPLAVASVVVLAAGMALYLTLACAVSYRLTADALHRITGMGGQILIASVWASSFALAEWLRGTLFTGLPWLNIGYAHVDGFLAGWAPIFGVYGMAWLAAFISAAIALLARAQGSPNDTPAATAVATGIVLALAGMALSYINWSRPHGQPTLVRLAQGNIPQSEKFDPALMQQGIETYMQLAALPAKQEGATPSIIVLPETIMTLFQDSYAPQVWDQWRWIATRQNATILMGAPLHGIVDGQDRFTNSAIAFNGDTPLDQLLSGTPDMHYDKHHLVPFGEFIPTGFRWFVDAIAIPLGDFNRGSKRQSLFQLDGQVIAPNICYEDVFGEEIIQSVRASEQHGPGATMLVNLSNLGWFGNSWALSQHLQISRMRSLETARPMLRATNTGMTAAIDPDGAVRAVLPPHIKGVLDVEVQGTEGLTPYVRWGNTPVLILSVLLLGLGFYRVRRPTCTQQKNGA